MSPNEVRDACRAALAIQPDAKQLLATLDRMGWNDRDWCDVATGLGESIGDGCSLEEAVSDFPEYVRETEKMEKEAFRESLLTAHQEKRLESRRRLERAAREAEARQEPLL